uniref:Plasmid stabilization system protein ParE n=1 Tax=Candidatus Kentrum sp. TC TaxID=2126339 RepID=A0A450YN39_9GAMM|nr:MAG: Plasmid stabilization system protein ParE [Candidatus Kentron sp. TC]VFK57282.1 MAG: Plasmid stabilization system protein ParE [Candidatus Kentron sp. TC]
MVIKWSKRARADIRDPKAYITKDSPYHARRFTERIIASVENLETFPKMGRLVPEAKGREDIRELIYQGYRIIYLTQPKQVFIITILHGSRDLEGQEDKPWNENQVEPLDCRWKCRQNIQAIIWSIDQRNEQYPLTHEYHDFHRFRQG